MHARYRAPVTSVLLALTCAAAPPAAAQAGSPLVPSPLEDWSYYGYSVAVSDGVAVVGAPQEGGAGRVHVFRHDGGGWVEEQVLGDAGGRELDYFGSAVAVSGDLLVVAADLAPEGEAFGNAYVFRHDGERWVEEHRWTHVGASTLAVAADGPAGAPGDETVFIGDARESVVRAYRRAGGVWELDQVITGSDVPPEPYGNGFAQYYGSVAVSRDVLVVGAPSDDETGDDIGAAYVFRYDGEGWVEEAKLTRPQGEGAVQFGRAVAAHGGFVVLSASADPYLGQSSVGSAYVFRYTDGAWAREQRLSPADGATDYRFGAGLAAADDRVLVGAPGAGGSGAVEDAGAVYVFRHAGGSWSQEGVLVAADPTAGARFGGEAVAASEEFVVVGAAGNGAPQGGAYVFTTTAPTASEGDAAAGPLALAFPNPSRDRTTVRFTLTEAGPATLEVVDVLGRTVAVLFDGAAPAGWHTAVLDAGSLAPGAYVLVLTGGHARRAQRLTVIP